MIWTFKVPLFHPFQKSPKGHQMSVKRANERMNERTDGRTNERTKKQRNKQTTVFIFFFHLFYVNKYIRKCNFLYMKNVREIAQACGKVESYIYFLNSIVVKIKTQNIHQQLKWQTTTFFSSPRSLLLVTAKKQRRIPCQSMVLTLLVKLSR